VAGTVYAQVNLEGWATYARIVAMDTSSPNTSAILRNNTSTGMELFSTSDLASTSNSYTMGVTSKIASTWDSTGTAICMDAGTVGSNSTNKSSVFGAETTYLLMSDGGQAEASGYLYRVAAWTARASNSNLQTLTT
jgi:hypothetical protein